MDTNKRSTDQAFCTPEVRYAIADYLDIPNEKIIIRQVVETSIFFYVPNGAHATHYTASLVRQGSRLKKNSIRIDR